MIKNNLARKDMREGKEVMNEMEIYLKSTEAINSDHEAIQDAAKGLTSACTSDLEKAIQLFYFVRDSIKYNMYMISVYLDDFKASTTLTRGKGYCVQKAVLLAALGRAASVPTRLVFAKIRNYRVPAHVIEQIGTNIFPGHGYNQFYLHEKWVSAAATFDKELCQRNGLRTVEFNGMHDATLPKTDLVNNPYIEYLEIYEPQADLPLKWLTKEISKTWGTGKRAWLSEEDPKDYEVPLR